MQIDKITHALACMVIAQNVTALYHAFCPDVVCHDDCLVGLIVAMLVGCVKECYDGYTGKGTFDMYDVLADFVGACVGTALVFGYSWII